jgi:type II secretion system protein C
MNLVSKQWFLSLMSKILIILIIAKSVSLLMLWLLPGEGVNYHQQQSMMPTYHRYSLKPMIVSSKSAEPSKTVSGPSISNMVIKGLYRKKTGGFVIVALKSAQTDTKVIGIGEKFRDYALVEILEDGAIFERNHQRYSLFLEKPKNLPARAAAAADIETPHQVSRSDIAHYAKNFDQIWKDISIAEVKKEGKIAGFKVTRIKPNSPFAELGLQKGDVIINANNKALTSYAQALEIYKNIDKLQAIELIVLRNNQEKELIYEIY